VLYTHIIITSFLDPKQVWGWDGKPCNQSRQSDVALFFGVKHMTSFPHLEYDLLRICSRAHILLAYYK